jgi:hypothetical protein
MTSSFVDSTANTHKAQDGIPMKIWWDTEFNSNLELARPVVVVVVVVEVVAGASTGQISRSCCPSISGCGSACSASCSKRNAPSDSSFSRSVRFGGATTCPLRTFRFRGQATCLRSQIFCFLLLLKTQTMEINRGNNHIPPVRASMPFKVVEALAFTSTFSSLTISVGSNSTTILGFLVAMHTLNDLQQQKMQRVKRSKVWSQTHQKLKRESFPPWDVPEICMGINQILQLDEAIARK